jgi:hypothetical protein
MKAEEMFNDLGYKKEIDNELKRIYYEKPIMDKYIQSPSIMFELKFKSIDVNYQLTIDVLEAIYQQCKELGWIDD